MKLISDKIKENKELMYQCAIAKDGKELRKIKKELVNYRPIVPLIRVFWESFINLYNFDKFDKDYIGFIKLKQMFSIYNHLNKKNETLDFNKKMVI